LAGKVRNFGPYLHRAVANQVKSAFRSRSRERREAARGRADERVDTSVDDRVGLQDELLRALALLSPNQRTAVMLFYYEDQPLEAVAEVMGTSVGTAKSHVSRGRDRLREALEAWA
jgi:RNA polymerase sigma-70 factor (ECF subfamily)